MRTVRECNRAWVNVYVRASVCVPAFVRVRPCLYASVSVLVCVCACVRLCVRAFHTHARTLTHSRTNTHTHPHTHAVSCVSAVAHNYELQPIVDN